MPTEETFWRIVGIFSIVVAAVTAALWRHIVEDGKVRERLATLEADNHQTKEEVRSLRIRLHELSREMASIIASWVLRLTGKKDKD